MLSGVAIDVVGRILISLSSEQQWGDTILMPLVNQELEEREVNKCRTKWVWWDTAAIHKLL